MPRNLVNQALWRRPHPQNRKTPRVDLRPPRVGNHLGRDAQTPRHAHQLHHLVLALDLHSDLLLAAALPPPEEARLGGPGVALRCAREFLVACERGVRGLRGYLACWRETD